MAQRIAAAIAGNLALVTEAGTGKTFAYLVSALLSGGKVIVSTREIWVSVAFFARCFA